MQRSSSTDRFPPPQPIPSFLRPPFRHSCAGRNQATSAFGTRRSIPTAQASGGGGAAGGLEPRRAAPAAPIPACAGMTEEGGAGMTRGRRGMAWARGASGAGTTAGARSLPPTPHLTSLLKGGRDELGKGWVGTRWCARGGSCLRRNDGGGRRNGGEGARRGEGDQRAARAGPARPLAHARSVPPPT